MTFDDVLERAIELLSRRGRLTYRTLKRQFQLDDDFLADLTHELVRGQRLAMDEGGEVLIWVGGGQAAPAGAADPQPGAAGDPEITDYHLPRLAYAERRQLTVMFCDLVASTALAGQLDPEDLREVIRAYQSSCDAVVDRFDGYIAQYLGDGIMAYFGYPRAHENDGERAVSAGLGIIETMVALNQALEHDMGISLALRIGIHTGLVVVGEVGSGERREQLALGEAPNVAARLQGLAEPDTVLVSSATHRLIAGHFDCESLGTRIIKGITAPIGVYRVLRTNHIRERSAAAGGPATLFGRERELETLRERWRRTRGGCGQVMMVSGEAGIGKSRMVASMQALAAADDATVLSFRCSPYYTSSALHPVIDHLQQHLHAFPDASAKLHALEDMLDNHGFPLDEVVPLFASLLSVSLPDRYAPLGLTPQRQKQKTLSWLVEWLLSAATERPALAVWEDLHCADPSTLELLGSFTAKLPGTRMMAMLVFRPEFEPSWPEQPGHSRLALTRLERPEIEQMVAHLTAGKPLPGEVLGQIAAKTDGVPLFVEEVTKLMLESGMLREHEYSYELVAPLSSLAVPATLHDSLMARLDRLSMSREIAQIGATIGREFSYQLIAAVSPLEPEVLQEGLRRLVHAELLYQTDAPPGAIYIFKHALIQETAYQSLLKSTRQDYHRRIVHALEGTLRDLAAGRPELLAHHCTQAGMHSLAVSYWKKAGERAIARSAHAEALSHLGRALTLLPSLPPGRATQTEELDLQIMRGVALNATRGYSAPEVGRAYDRARELCRTVGETTQFFPAIYGLWRFYLLSAEYQTARELGQELLSLAEGASTSAFMVESRRALGSTLFYLGEFAASSEHLGDVLTTHADPEHRSTAMLYDVVDPWITSRSYSSWNLWFLGYPDRARAESRIAIREARELGHPFSMALALSFASWLHQFCGEPEIVREYADEAIAISTEQDFQFWLGWCTVLRGWTIAAAGRSEEAIYEIRRGLSAWHATGSNLGRSYFLSLLADVYARTGDTTAALRALDEARTFSQRTGERWWTAELHRLRGEIMASMAGAASSGVSAADPADAGGEAVRCFASAQQVAAEQGSRALELRVALSMSRLGLVDRDTLSGLYSCFAEGKDTVDLRRAKAIITKAGE